MLPRFITESSRIAGLNGNVGRKVSRQLEQLFPEGVFAVTFDCPAAEDLADRALFMVRMQQAVFHAQRRSEKNRYFDISVRTTPTPGNALVEVTPRRIPGTMRERQQLLADFADMMGIVVVTAMMTDTDCLQRVRREQLEDLAFDLENDQYVYLAELAAGNYKNLTAVGMNFMTLAIALNPAVEEQFQAEIRRETVEA